LRSELRKQPDCRISTETATETEESKTFEAGQVSKTSEKEDNSEEQDQGIAGRSKEENRKWIGRQEKAIGASGTANLDHDDVAHAIASALDVALGTIEFERTRTCSGDAGKGDVPEKHFILWRCRLYRIRVLVSNPQKRVSFS